MKKVISLLSLMSLMFFGIAIADNSAVTKDWEDLAASTDGGKRVVFSVQKGTEVQVCLAQEAPTECRLVKVGDTLPKGCYVILAKDFGAWVAPRGVASQFPGGKFVTGSKGSVPTPLGRGCGPVQSYDYWLVVDGQ